jgi:hypothetical protein
MMNSRINMPIFVVGTGRSGSTIFFDIFSTHPQVAWLSRLSRDRPASPGLNVLLMRCLDTPLLGDLLRRRFNPSEAYPFWDLHCPGFSNPCRDLVADDVTPIAAARIRQALEAVVTKRRNRFLAKITGWPRVLFLRELFPQALFIEVTRDPCATAASLMEVAFWDGWRGPPNWRRGPLPPDLCAIWEAESRSFIALAAIEYVIVHRAMVSCRVVVPAERIYTVSYLDLCSNPVDILRSVCEFCRLEWSAQFEKSIRRVRLDNRDKQWRTKLTVAQQAILERTLARASTSTDPRRVS